MADQIVPNRSIFTTIVMVTCITAGTRGRHVAPRELITDRGIGNGMSILMFISIAAGFPGALWAIKPETGKLAKGWIEFGTVILIGFVGWSPWSSSSSRPSAVIRFSTRSA